MDNLLVVKRTWNSCGGKLTNLPFASRKHGKNRLKDRSSTAEWTGHAVAFYADTQVKPGRRRASVDRTRTAANEDRFRLKGKAVCMESFPQPRQSYESDYRFVKRLGGDAIEKCHDWRPLCHRRDAQERGCV